MKIATDLSVVTGCEILTDAVNVSSSGYPEAMHTPIDGMEYGRVDYDYAYDDMAEARSGGSGIQTTALREKSPAKYASPTKPIVQLRTFFPENWLFDLQDSDVDGIKDPTNIHGNKIIDR